MRRHLTLLVAAVAALSIAASPAAATGGPGETSPSWSVSIRPLHKTPAFKKTQRGKGDAVYRVTVKKTTTWSLRYKAAAKSRFTVKTYGLILAQELVSKKTKKYSGKARVEGFSG